MPYLNKNSELKRGYNVYIDSDVDDMKCLMDVGLLIMEEGDTWEYENASKEIAIDMLEGTATFEWNGKVCEADRPNSFHYEAYCLLASRKTKIKITAKKHSEFYIQATKCDNDYEPIMFTPDTVQTEHKGFKGELKGCMEREIKTFFDYENAPFSNMVLGEILNLPGKWSSYPPHFHPQPEIYFYRFDYPQGFGFGMCNNEVFKIEQNGCGVITEDVHPHVIGPGYACCYMWGIRHLDGNPWIKTRTDDKAHEWLWKEDANDHIYPNH